MSTEEVTKQKQLVLELRARLQKTTKFRLEERRLNNDKFLERYLKQNKWSVDKCENMLEYYMQINEEYEWETLLTREFPPDVQSICKGRFVGWDYENRPVAMVPDTSADYRTFLEKADEAKVKELFSCILKHQLLMDHFVLQRNSDHGVCIIDAAGIKYSQYLSKRTIDFMLNNAKILDKHSPGMSGKIIIVNAPKILKTIINMMKKLITFTAEVIIYDKDDKDWKQKLREHVPAEGLCEEFGGTLKEFAVNYS